MELTLFDYQIIIASIVVAIILHFLVKKILTLIGKMLAKININAGDYLITILKLPLRLIIWLIFAYIITDILNEYYQVHFIYKYLEATIIIIAIIISIKTLKSLEEYLNTKKIKFDSSTISLFIRISKIIIVTILVLAMLQGLGFNINSILAFGGIGGLVIGMAAKDMLANIFGGLMVNIDKPFIVGDWIRVGEIEGTVENIGWRITRIKTFSKNPIYVPNSMFSTRAIETPSRMDNRRIREVIGIRYDDVNKVKVLEEEINELLTNHEEIDDQIYPMVYFDKFNNSSLDLVVTAYTKTTEKLAFQKAKSDILLEIHKIIANHGAEFAFPTQTIKLENTTKDNKEAKDIKE